MKNFKTNLKNVPNELFNQIETLLSEHGMDDVKVTGIDIIPTRELTAEDCARQGKKLKCKKSASGSIKCWCVKMK